MANEMKKIIEKSVEKCDNIFTFDELEKEFKEEKTMLNTECIKTVVANATSNIEDIVINNTDEKQQKIEKLADHVDWELHKILFPEKEGKKNFKNLDPEKKEEILEKYPFFRKNETSRKWEYRTSIGYFGKSDEEYAKSMVTSSYSKVSDAVCALVAAASFMASAVITFKWTMNVFKKMLNK